MQPPFMKPGAKDGPPADSVSRNLSGKRVGFKTRA